MKILNRLGIYTEKDMTNILSHLNRLAHNYHSDVKRLINTINDLLNINEISKQRSHEPHYTQEEARASIINNASKELDMAEKGLADNLAYFHAANKSIYHSGNDTRPEETKSDRKYWREELCSFDGQTWLGGDTIIRLYYEKFPNSNPHNIHISHTDIFGGSSDIT
jgi:hypothetical protein